MTGDTLAGMQAHYYAYQGHLQAALEALASAVRVGEAHPDPELRGVPPHFDVSWATWSRSRTGTGTSIRGTSTRTSLTTRCLLARDPAS